MENIDSPHEFRIHLNYGKPYITAVFKVGDVSFTLVFNDILTVEEMRTKQYHIDLPAIDFPENGMVELYFDIIDHGINNFGSFRHISLLDVIPLTLKKVVRIIKLHYTVRKPGGYLFYAARSSDNRVTDLKNVYDQLLGLKVKRNGKFAYKYIPADWRIYNGLCGDGRGYVIICSGL
ncbi:hypothetical protein N5923_19120 [Erwiniaceae bacterium BAC15a-03b]|uniref:Uncharacterized protein n=1 Tax=Winslowiella arboricola TaxID=2978220 RepID=A0A9J6PMS2_9GAMM|nr:hypothetical protein [Winslowiella arboricola]MCU5775549.1 hypothetical protein [Winslowiella arboricola]MCU5779601.1 hypothetical protein [Winslowiella arboricola]